MESNKAVINKIKNEVINKLELIKVYCQTIEASGYTKKELILLKSEFEPILNECDKAIREVKAL